MHSTRIIEAEIFRAPNNDGTGRHDYHVSLTSDGKPLGLYGGFYKLSTAKACAKENGAKVVTVKAE